MENGAARGKNGQLVAPAAEAAEPTANGGTGHDEILEFEDIIESLGSFGHWQRVIFVLICLADVWGAFAMLAPVITGATPNWYCDTRGNTSDDVTIRNESRYVTSHNLGVSRGAVGVFNKTERACELGPKDDIQRCGRVEFADDFTSIVSEWGLVCSRAYVSDLITSIQMAGLVLGAALFGQLSDTIGRKRCYFLAFTILWLSGLISGIVPHWEVYAAARFFVGVGFGALMVVNCVYPLEFVGQRWRTLCGTIGFWAIGGMLLGLAGFLLREWRHLVIVTSASGAVFLITWPFLPESPRWLAQKERYEEAQVILAKIAEKNNRPVPDISVLKKFSKQNRADEDRLRHYTYLDLFRRLTYAKKTLIVMAIWFSSFLMYYELAVNLRQLSGDRYFNLFLAGFVDLGAMLLVIALNNVLGRRITQLMFFIIAIGGNLLIIIAFAVAGKDGLSSLVLVGALTGKAAALGGTYVIQIFTAELYPTVVRNQGVGAGAVAGRVGGILAPQLVFLGQTYFYLIPHILTTSLCCVCLPLLFLLPETNGKPLDDSYVDSENQKSSKSSDVKQNPVYQG